MRTGNRHKATGNRGKAVRIFGSVLCASAVTPIFDLRLLISALCALLVALCSFVEAQQSKVPRIGGIFNDPGKLVDAFRQGLRDLGYVEGQNLVVEYRYIEGDRDRIPGLVNELLQLKVDLLVATSPPTIRAAKQSTKAIPIVMVTPQDPVANGIVESFARPGGNITGLTTLTRQLSGKSLELLKEVIPTLSRVGILAVEGPTVPGNALRVYEATARELKIAVHPLAGKQSEARYRWRVSRRG